jgi:hypothetical protein
MNWYEHLTDIYSVANVSIDRDEKIVVIEPKYLQRLVQLLDQTSPRVIGNVFLYNYFFSLWNWKFECLLSAANFIHWRLILENIYDVNIEMAILAIEFYDAIYGPFPLQPR